MEMDKYFNTLDSTRRLYIFNCLSKGQIHVDKEGLRSAMKSALKRHHDVGAEANYIINTYSKSEGDQDE
tara:strand:- start:384 stop:590 length:207 start_codon:yes stop_codon:yes gene_type:complete